MIVEREHLIESVIDRVKTTEGSPFVSRNLNLIANISTFPAIFVIDDGDDFESGSGPTMRGNMPLGLLTIVKGDDPNSAAQDLAQFQIKMLQALFPNQKRSIGTTYRGALYPDGISAIVFPSVGNNTAAQRLNFYVMYAGGLTSD
jgi:hypothetical protein